jgi:hypothetical protein
MRYLFLALIVLHGLLHFMGPAKAFGLAELPQLTQPISRGMGSLWLVAGVALLLSGAAWLSLPRVWWMLALVAVVLSQIAIVASWQDAKVGTLANILILLVAAYGFASQGPFSFRAAYERELDARLPEGDAVEAPPLTEDDIAHLPELVQRYLRVTSSVGRPRIHHYKAVWRGRIRESPDDAWMTFTAEQVNFTRDPARFFLMDARRTGLPVDVYHAFADGTARMRVRVLSAIPVADTQGPQLTRAETVTLFNDLSLLAPAGLIDPAITWEPVDDRSVRAHYALGPHTISAVLEFNDAGELVDFISDDRSAASEDGALTPVRFSTPVSDYRNFEGRRVVTRGEGRWHPPEGAFTYIELELLAFEVNGGR